LLTLMTLVVNLITGFRPVKDNHDRRASLERCQSVADAEKLQHGRFSDKVASINRPEKNTKLRSEQL